MRLLVRLVAVATLVAATGSGALTGASQAAACSGDSGVTVVVDFHQLGGGVVQKCDPAGAGKSASALFADNGFALTYVQRQPGFVCRVSGKPAADPCVNTPPSNAYWGLYWSDGTSGSWSYAAQGTGSLNPPDGGAVAFSWQGSTTKAPPGVAPPDHTSSPSASPSASASGGGSGTRRTPSATAGSASPTASALASADGSETPTATPSKSRSAKPVRSRSASATPSLSEVTQSPAPAAVVTTEPPADASRGLPAWLLVLVLATLVVAAATTAAVRARGSRTL